MINDINTQILTASMDSEQAETIGEYLQILLETLWLQNSSFDGKRPFGYSSWRYEVYEALIRAGLIDGALDDNGYVMDLSDGEQEKGDQLILNAINNVFQQYHGDEGDKEAE